MLNLTISMAGLNAATYMLIAFKSHFPALNTYGSHVISFLVTGHIQACITSGSCSYTRLTIHEHALNAASSAALGSYRGFLHYGFRESVSRSIDYVSIQHCNLAILF